MFSITAKLYQNSQRRKKMYLMLNEETVDFREEKGFTVKRIIRGWRPMIHRFSDKFAATSARSLCVPPDAFKQMEIYAVGRRIPSVHRIMESTRGKIMHGRFVRWPPLHSADSPSPYNGPPRRFRPVLLTENRRSLSRMPLQPSVVPSRLSTPSPPRRLSRTRHWSCFY